MKKKGLVYRMTTLLGLTIIAFQFGGELFYSKYIKADRDLELQHEKKLEEKMSKYDEEDYLDEEMKKDIENNKKGGMFNSWSEARRKRLEKIK